MRGTLGEPPIPRYETNLKSEPKPLKKFGNHGPLSQTMLPRSRRIDLKPGTVEARPILGPCFIQRVHNSQAQKRVALSCAAQVFAQTELLEL